MAKGKGALLGGVLLVLACGVVSPAHADDITITSGYLDTVFGRGDLSLTGTSEFTFSAHVAHYDGIFDSYASWPNEPGTTLSLRASWSGNDLRGLAILGGVTYPEIGGTSSPNFLNIVFSGTALLPPFSPDGAVITSPFAFQGVFGHAPSLSMDAPVTRDELTGRGIATITLRPVPQHPGSWRADAVRYDFAPSTVPEPSALALLGSGLIGLAWRTMRLRRRAPER